MLVYCLSIISEYWSETDTMLLNCLSVERQRKISRYVNISDKKLSLYAELLARMSLSQMIGIPASELQFYYQPNHKPTLLSFPDIDFSFSHTKNRILCCLSANTSVGADVEFITSAPLDIMNQVFHPREIEYIKTAPMKQIDTHFFEIWTRKEAYTKFLGIGLVYDLCACNTFDFSSKLYTWQEEDYCHSICGNILKPLKIISISEKEVQNYFTNVFYTIQ